MAMDIVMVKGDTKVKISPDFKEYYEKRLRDGRQIDLAHKMYQTENDARLNCDWVEWLMGYPIGWTNLEESQESQPNNKTEQTD